MTLFYLAQVIKQNELKVPKPDFTTGTFSSILQMIFGIAGSIALLSITYGALKYVMSQGDSSQLAKAKDTIMYSIVGLVICIAAFSIVTFVVDKL
jgi:hypothetical protein